MVNEEGIVQTEETNTDEKQRKTCLSFLIPEKQFEAAIRAARRNSSTVAASYFNMCELRISVMY